MSASKIPIAVLVEAAGHDVGIAVPDRQIDPFFFYLAEFVIKALWDSAQGCFSSCISECCSLI